MMWRQHSLLVKMMVVLLFLVKTVMAESADSVSSGQPAVGISGDADSGSTEADRSFPVYASWRGIFAPGSDLYPRYIADPLQPTMAMQYLIIFDSDIPNTGDSRFLYNLGGRFGLVRLYPNNRTDAGFQIDVQAAFLGMFDIENQTDNIGWDGLYGLLLTWADGQGTAVKVAIQHDSSHIGDEYIESTGRTRINYTREEVVLGLSRKIISDLRVYGEGAYGYDLRNTEIQDPWRLQGGLEYKDDDRFMSGRLGWYAAVDMTFYEENDWDLNLSIQAGLVAPIRNLARTFRLGVGYYNGRSILGEFSQFDEEYFSFGLWVDL
ncbi:MAG: DUF1207 domain-containing protein [Desulfobacterales bacterium]